MTDYGTLLFWRPGGIAMDTHEGTGILPKAACSRHPALAPSQYQRARLPESSLKIVFAAFVVPRDERAMPTKFRLIKCCGTELPRSSLGRFSRASSPTGGPIVNLPCCTTIISGQPFEQSRNDVPGQASAPAPAPTSPSERLQARTLRTESESSSCGTPLRHSTPRATRNAE